MPDGTETLEISTREFDSLLTNPKAAMEYRIIRATKVLLHSHGLGISMDQIADQAGVGRRTVFRYFESRDDLVARALREQLDSFHATAMRTRESGESPDEWLAHIVSELYITQTKAGMALWQLAVAQDSELPPPIAQLNTERRARRLVTTHNIAAEAWGRFGNTGQVPRDVEIAFALAISTFAVHSVGVDYGVDNAEAVTALTSILRRLIRN